MRMSAALIASSCHVIALKLMNVHQVNHTLPGLASFNWTRCTIHVQSLFNAEFTLKTLILLTIRSIADDFGCMDEQNSVEHFHDLLGRIDWIDWTRGSNL
jgi:hypothetical protein